MSALADRESKAREAREAKRQEEVARKSADDAKKAAAGVYSAQPLFSQDARRSSMSGSRGAAATLRLVQSQQHVWVGAAAALLQSQCACVYGAARTVTYRFYIFLFYFVF